MSTGLAADMGRPKAKPSDEREDPRKTWERKPVVLQMRGSLEWKAWLEKAAKFNRMTVAAFIDQAVAKAGRDSGFTEAPPER